MIRLFTSKRQLSLRWYIFFAIALSCLIVFVGASTVSSLQYEALMARQEAVAKEQLQERFPDQDIQIQLPPITADVRFTYILSFSFFSLFFLLLAGYLSHLAVRRINRALSRFQKQINSIQSAQDLRDFNAQPEGFVFNEISEAFEEVNKLARQLDSILVDKSLLETALEESEHEDSMAAEILYGHLIDKNADDPLGVTHSIRSSSNFSGDIVLVRRSPSGSIFVLLADATGHGLSATITIMPVISVFDAMVNKGHRMPFILREMNKRLLNDLPDDRFVAATLIELDPMDQELRLWNGAMPQSLLVNAQGEVLQSFQSRHMALGILDDQLFETSAERLPLPQDGYLLSMSDGLLEQVNGEDDSFGEKRLLDKLRQLQPDNYITGLLEAVEDHSRQAIPDDDISLVLMDFDRLKSRLSPAEGCQFTDLNLPRDPFEWKIKVQGEQLINEALPALTHDFLQTLGMDTPLIQRIFTVAHELTSWVLHSNILELSPNLKSQLLETKGEAGLQYYYQQRREALERLPADSFLELCMFSEPGTAVERGKLEIQVRDNGLGQSALLHLDDHNFHCHYSHLEVLEDGHFIIARL
ncbi:PP2C family protein-serine/threonine phosphatase [Marinospirillum perlucidum]|uniref:PP2C family protein-serine/threonine phosphatase n=1 Tax=Marinospirillum perlucidum TaxID=1982602 RepID=UPI000DF300F2|nr:PP2C family protein-serine/threonine phosphatase [Marinospirillum perlucidum]